MNNTKFSNLNLKASTRNYKLGSKEIITLAC